VNRLGFQLRKEKKPMEKKPSAEKAVREIRLIKSGGAG